MIDAKLFPEIFEEFEKAETKADKMAILRKYWHPKFQEFLEYAFNPQLNLPV